MTEGWMPSIGCHESADRSRAQPATSAQRIACHLPAVKAVHDMAADHRHWVDRSARTDGAADLRQPHRAGAVASRSRTGKYPSRFRADTCPIQASGPCRRCLTRKRCSGHGWRMRGSGRNFFGDHVHATPVSRRFWLPRHRLKYQRTLALWRTARMVSILVGTAK
jgi:hypothetical protein